MTGRQKNDLQSHISTLCKILPDVADLRDYEYAKIFQKTDDYDYESFNTMTYRYNTLSQAAKYIEMAISSLNDAIFESEDRKR